MSGARLGGLTWPELDRPAADLVLAVPLGATEQHGPHLPLDTDTRVARALVARLAAARTDVLVAPALPYGSSGEHERFPGTLSIGQEALEHLVVELVRSATRWVGRVVLVSGHGGNERPLRAAERRLREEGRAVLAWTPRLPATDAHAGRTETSLLLALAPDEVRPERLAAGNTAPLGELMAVIGQGTVRAVSENGVLGDPHGASAEEGWALLERMGSQLEEAVARWLA